MLEKSKFTKLSSYTVFDILKLCRKSVVSLNEVARVKINSVATVSNVAVYMYVSGSPFHTSQIFQ